MNLGDLTRAELRELVEMKDQEAGVYLSLLVPLLQRLGGSTVISAKEAGRIPEGTLVGVEEVEGSGLLVFLKKEETR